MCKVYFPTNSIQKFYILACIHTRYQHLEPKSRADSIRLVDVLVEVLSVVATHKTCFKAVINHQPEVCHMFMGIFP